MLFLWSRFTESSIKFLRRTSHILINKCSSSITTWLISMFSKGGWRPPKIWFWFWTEQFHFLIGPCNFFRPV
jgi:hypothetical protein